MRKLIAFAALAAAIACVAANAAAARPPGSSGKIVTNSENLVTGAEQVYTVDPDGTDETPIANNAEVGQWSPDGALVQLFTDSGERTFNPDTGESRDLGLPDTHYPGLLLFCGVWSPDGARLACEGFGLTDPNRTGIYSLVPGQQPLLTSPCSPIRGSASTWRSSTGCTRPATWSRRVR